MGSKEIRNLGAPDGRYGVLSLLLWGHSNQDPHNSQSEAGLSGWFVEAWVGMPRSKRLLNSNSEDEFIKKRSELLYQVQQRQNPLWIQRAWALWAEEPSMFMNRSLKGKGVLRLQWWPTLTRPVASRKETLGEHSRCSRQISWPDERNSEVMNVAPREEPGPWGKGAFS